MIERIDQEDLYRLHLEEGAGWALDFACWSAAQDLKQEETETEGEE